MKENILELGNLIVNELGIEENDTLAKWIAFYISEKMTISEKLSGDEKESAQKDCFDTILKLWQYRSMYPNEHRPFERFEAIFRTIERLNHESSNLFFNRRYNSKDDVAVPDNVKYWLDISLRIDQTARIWLEYTLFKAITYATDEETIKWLKNSIGFEDSIESSIILQFIDLHEYNSEVSAEELKKKKKDKIVSKMNVLEDFIELNKEIMNFYQQELDEL